MSKAPVTEFEAAAMTAMSPELLRWFTKYSVKYGINRKLKVADKKNDAYFFDPDEVLSFDQWLRLPWPKKDGKRPGVPSGITKEIKQEAGGECAICHSHRDTCEAAHIDPVAASANNHPENLIWLCANHHTAYDKGLYGPAKGEEEFVAGFKLSLRRFKVMLWKTQHEASHVLFSVLDSCDHLQAQLAAAKTVEQVGAIQALAEKTLKQLPRLAAVSKTDPNYENVASLSKGVADLRKTKAPIAEKLRAAQDLRSEYVAAFGFVACPLCKGTGHHDYGDCPVCHGDREVEEQLAHNVDLHEFEKVRCPLCVGKGRWQGDDCPACGGNREMDHRYAEQIDRADYENVECPACGGTGILLGRTCAECGGDCVMERRHAERMDKRDFEVVACPLCGGNGQHDHRDCPECGGNGELLARDAANVDLRDYEKAKCPLCRGGGQHNDRDCQVCGGEGEIDKKDRASIDLSDYEDVKCPACKGRPYSGDFECRYCGGEGRVERRFADSYDSRD